jgi:hypothetical protein
MTTVQGLSPPRGSYHNLGPTRQVSIEQMLAFRLRIEHREPQMDGSPCGLNGSLGTRKCGVKVGCYINYDKSWVALAENRSLTRQNSWILTHCKPVKA